MSCHVWSGLTKLGLDRAPSMEVFLWKAQMVWSMGTLSSLPVQLDAVEELPSTLGCKIFTGINQRRARESSLEVNRA